ncbi:TRAP-type C4-dicarboxylate transport system [Halorhodospira halochloris]|uniref:TRAP transporter small permease protein n=1 Tax=Halorhodospira halochloris TaxID=1052 RepID=A0A0X8XBG0_HALHR|nr:TRAP transporter small permease [Halorhodospira halochloris]MBK1651860.1 hypothetical protein [Halorhodospira halochloris]BAU58804.1 TRAP-type C4-dicarboxylate transport system [Halorhodospira halochloris]
MPAGNYLHRLDRGVERFESIILAGGVLALAAVSITNTLLRNLLGTTLPGASELTEIFMIWITFAGLAYAVRRARHIAMTALYDQLRGIIRKALLVTISVGSAALLFYLSYFALIYVLSTYQGGRTTTALSIPVWAAYAIVPAGLFLGAIQYSLTAWRNLSTAGIHRSFQERERYEQEPSEGEPKW